MARPGQPERSSEQTTGARTYTVTQTPWAYIYTLFGIGSPKEASVTQSGTRIHVEHRQGHTPRRESQTFLLPAKADPRRIKVTYKRGCLTIVVGKQLPVTA